MIPAVLCSGMAHQKDSIHQIGVSSSRMGRTNIEIDDELVHRVMVMFNLTTKREAVDLALRRLALPPMSKEEALAVCGSMPDFEVPEDGIAFDHDWHDAPAD